MRLKDLGERRILERIHSFLGVPGVTGFKDDCFVDEKGLTISTDSGSLTELSKNAFDAGRKIIASNASDLYSTGATPDYFFINLSLSQNTEIEWLTRFFEGAQFEVKQAGGVIAGGDLGEGNNYSVTAIGHTNKPLLRQNCRVGDAIVCSNTVGGAAAAYLAKQNKWVCPPEFEVALNTPDPNYSFCKQAREKATAGMDVSDGLAFTLHELARLSTVKIIVEELPVPIGLERFCNTNKIDFVETAVSHGEDYCCVFSGEFKEGFARVEKGSGVFIEKDGDLIPLKKKGWEAFIG